MEVHGKKKISGPIKSKLKADLYLASSLYDGVEDNNLKQVTTLLKNNEADPNVLMPLHGITPFHLVIGNDSEIFAEEVTKLFLRYGGNPNVKSVDGMTPVHIAAAWGRTGILKLLLANGGDPLCQDCDNCTPFHYAFQGEHYETISVLSQHCMNDKDDRDEDIKYKLELDKILVNNGEVIAEYMVSDNSMLSSSYKSIASSNNNAQNFKNSSSDCSPENSSTPNALNSNFVTVRRNQRKRFAEEKTSNILKETEKDTYDFKRDTTQEEIELLNEIISQMSNSLTSDVDIDNKTGQNYKNECTVSCKTSSPKRMQMTMTFNRPSKCNNKYANQNNKNLNNNNTNNKTLQIIKRHNYIPQLKNNKISTSNSDKTSNISSKNFVSQKFVSSLAKKLTSGQAKSETPIKDTHVYSSAFNETIISKSPNLHIGTNSRERREQPLKTLIFEKKLNGIKKSSPIKPGKSSRTPRPKKYLATARCRTAIRKNSTTSLRQSNRRVSSARKPSSSDKQTFCSPLNKTFSKSESSTLSCPSSARAAAERKKNLKAVAVNLTARLQDEEEEEESFDSKASSDHQHHRNGQNDVAGGSEIMSGVKPLDSDVSSYSNGNETGLRAADEAVDQTMLESLSSAATWNSLSELKREKATKHDRCAIDSMLCEQGSFSISSDSYLSMPNDYDTASDKHYNNCANGETEIKRESSHCESTSSSGKLDSESFFSVEEEYKYEDPDEGVIFLERRLCVSPSYASSDMNTSFYSVSTAKSEPLPAELFQLDSVTLRERLKSLGENPGPITKTTHHLYLKRLYKLESKGTRPIHMNNIPNGRHNQQSKSSGDPSRERALLRPSLLTIDWLSRLNEFEALEHRVFQEFSSPQPSRKWREGTSKSSFNYLLLDPRLTRDLPRRGSDLSLEEKWKTFLSSIFYVGKGKRSRPYAHLYDAFKCWVDRGQVRPDNGKIRRILDIWDEGKGVVVLHVFHNTIPVEAYTREAAMIEVLGTSKLGNCKIGDYYGVVSTWRSREKCEFGRYLLYKAMQILLIEGERQIFPDNL